MGQLDTIATRGAETMGERIFDAEELKRRVAEETALLRRELERSHKREHQLKQTLDALPAAIYATDREGRITYYNKAAVDLAGREPRLGYDKWCVTWRLKWPDGRPLAHDECPMAIALKEDRPVRGAEALAERPDGTEVPFRPYPAPLHDENGGLVGAVNMLVDISEQKLAIAQQKALLDELNHRVKNTLATVQSLASQSFRGTDVPKAAFTKFQERLFALSRTHNQLSLQCWRAADVSDVVDGVVASCTPERRARVHISGAPVKIPPRVALSLAMVLHELISNAWTFGSLSSDEGALTLTWKVSEADDARSLEFDWRESGGPLVQKPEHRGFGSKLIERSIAQGLRGTSDVSYERSGVRAVFRIPLPQAGCDE